jgi:hypothetical protein
MDLKKIASFIGAIFVINKGLDVALVDYQLKTADSSLMMVT